MSIVEEPDREECSEGRVGSLCYWSGRRQKNANQKRHRDRQPDQDLPARRVVDIIIGGLVGRVTGKKHRDSLDSILTVSEQPARRDRPYPDIVISFSDEDYLFESMELHERALVITAQVGPVYMRRIMIDNGSSVDILYSHAY